MACNPKPLRRLRKLGRRSCGVCGCCPCNQVGCPMCPSDGRLSGEDIQKYTRRWVSDRYPDEVLPPGSKKRKPVPPSHAGGALVVDTPHYIAVRLSSSCEVGLITHRPGGSGRLSQSLAWRLDTSRNEHLGSSGCRLAPSRIFQPFRWVGLTSFQQLLSAQPT